MTNLRDVLQDQVFQWTRDTFGPETLAIHECVRRFLEECIELAQAEDLPKEVVINLVHHVYSKTKGDPRQEVGGVGITLLAYCGAARISAHDEEVREFQRVLSIPVDEFRRRHNLKADAGIALRVNGGAP